MVSAEAGLAGSPARDAGDLDIFGGAEFAARRRSRSAAPTPCARRLANSTSTSTPGRPIQRSSGSPRACASVLACTRSRKAALARQDAALGVDDDESLRHGADDARRRRRLRRRRRDARLAEARQQNEQMRGAVLTKQRTREQHRRLARAPAATWTLSTRGATRAAATKDCAACRLRRVEQLGERLADQPSWRPRPSSAAAAGLASTHALVAGIDDQHRLGGELKQQAIALFGVADARVFALHRLLRLGEALLQRRHARASRGRPRGCACRRRSGSRSSAPARRGPRRRGWLTCRQRVGVGARASRSRSSIFGRLSTVTVSTQRWPTQSR